MKRYIVLTPEKIDDIFKKILAEIMDYEDGWCLADEEYICEILSKHNKELLKSIQK